MRARDGTDVDETRPLSTAPVPGPGTLLAGRYELHHVLGRGGMADVMQATDTSLGREVAIKLFRPEVAAAAEHTRSTGEIRALARLHHPGLVTLFDAGTANADTLDARPFLVMELVTGPTLADLLREGPLPSAAVADLGGQLADTLVYVHANGIVHRDVKPANILLARPAGGASRRWAAKLTDFGVARLIDSTRLTLAGMTVGTANYLSPEQATGQDVGPGSDVYALGLVLLECLTGEVVFPGSAMAAATARLHRDPEIPAFLDDRWHVLLADMTRREPSGRPGAAAAAAALREIATLSAVAADREVPAAHGAAATRETTAAMPETITMRETRARGRPGRTGGPAPTAVLPASPEPAPRARRRRPAVVAFVTAAACAILVVAVLLISRSGGAAPAPSRAPAPSYPGVSGSAGPLVTQLERLVDG
ncbi:MAG: serine/threonine protein kinase [Jatrophihabitans sp.]|nr:MAG: serine/threonine protein kinase [Jatrophihabitans sp.]